MHAVRNMHTENSQDCLIQKGKVYEVLFNDLLSRNSILGQLFSQAIYLHPPPIRPLPQTTIPSVDAMNAGETKKRGRTLNIPGPVCRY